MKKRFVKQAAVLAAAVMMTVGMATTAMAAQWKQDAKGWWWQNDDGTYPTNCWKWLDGNKDGIAECYYFDNVGYMAAGTTTPDGYSVNSEGQWAENGAVKTQGTANNSGSGATVANGNSIRQNLQPGQTYQVSSGIWDRDEKGFKFKKPDGFVVDPTTKLYSKYAYDPYVRDDCWMTDDDGDGTWELYVFDENGYLCTDVDINGMGYTTWGLHDAYGRLSTQYYKGVWDDVGPIQVVNHDNAWYCENGTLPSFASNAAWSFTGDYARDAGEIYAGLKLQISRMSSGSYRNVETITIK